MFIAACGASSSLQRVYNERVDHRTPTGYGGPRVCIKGTIITYLAQDEKIVKLTSEP